MNYYDARPLADGSGFHFTCRNDDQIWPVGHCRDHGAHETADQARACFRQYLLDDISEETYGDWTGCEECDTPTKKGLTTRRPLGTGHPLYDEHRTHEQVEALTPEIGQITSSY